jgi:hypothetical protein
MIRSPRLVFIGFVVSLFSSLAFSQSSPAENEQYLEEIRKQIAGREEEPAEKVFQNIEILQGKKASRLPGMMKALTGLLGVDCKYCHVPGHWELEEKKAKVVARQHFAMQAAIMKQYFSDENKISCWTCHRGKPLAEFVPQE